MVLVTGATGLVGSHLVLHLIGQGQQVKALFRNEEGKLRVKSVFEQYGKADLFKEILWCQADIIAIPSLEAAFAAVDVVYHCAALVSFDPKDEEKLRKTNIEGTANIVNYCIDKKVRKICFVSSIAALGDLGPHEDKITEETEWNPEKIHSYYAISKYGAEMEVWRAQQEGLEVVVVNPGVILAPSFWKEGSGEIYQKVKKGLVFYTKGTTGFVSVNDVVVLMDLLMKGEVSGERFVLVSENKTYRELVSLMAEVLKVKKPGIYANWFLTGLAWRADWLLAFLFGKKRMLTRDLAYSLHSTDRYSNEKISTLLGFQFQDIEAFIRKNG
ncbi:NAD-dependent epimerase/dehydratase family protein [Flavobacterium humi]|uniref:NAD-dependent epimerase/dehydratase family protein n=1 Tax=Flavobacterium humi TaxID=2562683 RepID=A0A4Z0L8W2_9FLAO|nr:NAD-dependent epimerase/dehydratase family protein [Flavobacterium humi]TGD58449.1 NAD-dependent epimerase/dehydratase family protein [Flavobacterium humi]